MKKAASNFAVSVVGLITCMIAVAVLAYVELEFEIAVYSYLVFSAIPIGAIGAGVLAASGYYFGAIWLRRRPTPMLLFNMAAISAGIYFTFHYVIYRLLEIDGVAISSLMDFPSYVDISLTEIVTGFERGNLETDELRNLRFGAALLQIIGFSLGGFVVYILLQRKEFCENCNRYFKRVWTDTRYHGNAGEFVHDVAKAVVEGFHANDIKKARSAHKGLGAEEVSKATPLATNLSLDKCPACARRILLFEALKLKGNDWVKIDDLSFGKRFKSKIGSPA